MIKRFLFYINLCGLLTACATNRHGAISNGVIHDFFYPEYYSNRPCVIVDTVILPVDNAYFVKTSFLQIIDSAYEMDVSNFWEFTRPCCDSIRTLREDMADNAKSDQNTVFVADTTFLLEGSFIIYSLSDQKWLDQLYSKGKSISFAKQQYGYSSVEELFPFVPFLTDRCYFFAHQYSIVYDNYNFNMDNLSFPMTYVKFVILPEKNDNVTR